MLSLVSAAVGLAVIATEPEFPVAESPIPVSEWLILERDRFVVDTKENMGYLVHENGTYTEFPVATGQKRYVSYLGRTYNAATPLADWTVLSDHIQPNKRTFGKTGYFLRLYRAGDVRTLYGIHSHAEIATMLQDDMRYRSMGCILVSDEILDILKATYELNGKRLEVQTLHGLPDGNVLASY